jgi:hypothetical protein
MSLVCLHLIELEDALAGLHGNLTPTAIQRCGRSLQGCNTIVDGYTKGLEQFVGKPSNSTPSLQKDINMLVEVLKGEQLFKNVPGRQHRSFPAMEFDVSAKSPGTFPPVPP